MLFISSYTGYDHNTKQTNPSSKLLTKSHTEESRRPLNHNVWKCIFYRCTNWSRLRKRWSSATAITICFDLCEYLRNTNFCLSQCSFSINLGEKQATQRAWSDQHLYPWIDWWWLSTATETVSFPYCSLWPSGFPYVNRPLCLLPNDKVFLQLYMVRFWPSHHGLQYSSIAARVKPSSTLQETVVGQHTSKNMSEWMIYA